MTNIAEFKGVTYLLDDKVIIDDVTIAFKKKTFSVVFGPNGAGKTTLLKLLTGQITPQKGVIHIDGGSVEENLKKVGYVPQDFHNKKNFPISVFKTVLTGRYGRMGLFQRPSKKDKEIAHDSINLVGLSQFSNSSLDELSGGQLQRVFIARALATEPDLLLLDEASSGIDVGVKESIYDLLSRLKDKMAIIFVSHDMSVVSKGVDMVCCLDRKLVSHGSPDVALNDQALACMYGKNIATFSHCSTPHIHVHGHKD